MVCKFCKCLTFLVDKEKDVISNDEGDRFSQTNNDYALAFQPRKKQNLLGVLKKDMTYLMLDIKLGCICSPRCCKLSEPGFHPKPQ